MTKEQWKEEFEEQYYTLMECWKSEWFAFIEQQIHLAEENMKKRCLECVPKNEVAPTFYDLYPIDIHRNKLKDEIRTAINSIK